MVIFFLVYIVVCFWGAKLHRGLNRDYLSVDNTQAVKGVFILLVFFSHFNSYASYERDFDLIYKNTVTSFRQTMVTLFLFYSGYGVMESINKKGLDYLKEFPVKRILSTLFKFVCAVTLFFLIGTFVTAEKYTIPRVLLSLIGWESLGNSNWYIFVILVLYLISYAAFRFLIQKNRVIPLMISLAAVVALIWLNEAYNVKPDYWIDTALCYVAGMLYAQYRKPVEAAVNKHGLIYCAVTVLVYLAFAFLKKHMGNIVALIGVNLCFAGFVVLLSMRITVKNKILVWCGKNLFELYILQRIPMILFKQTGLAEWNVYLYFVACFAVTLILVRPFKYVTDKLWTLVLKTLALFRHKKPEKEFYDGF